MGRGPARVDESSRAWEEKLNQRTIAISSGTASGKKAMKKRRREKELG
jgi:hypothetical protein